MHDLEASKPRPMYKTPSPPKLQSFSIMKENKTDR